ncbi:DedA family protein [Dactylosporangium roseum]|uniref:DedA family protein n=1 Tax=Dactylosporangium roseum TaxID=47989 RepID=A0ABY5Z183_9ACTN|nr:DedA family protein [Dactylosporangium roseum]UWZ35419.1 DedA family protein [Dactylosporangium roseum]
MHFIEEWMGTLSPVWIYLLVGGVIGVESMGIPLPGEVALVTASLLSVGTKISPWLVAGSASAGAIIGDSIGYLIGRRGGRRLLERFGRRFPKHFGPAHLAKAERAFQRWGVWAVFFGRFIALLRILAGPLAGALHVPYGRFLAANALGGLTWAFGTVFAIYSVGRVAEKWLKDFSWIALAAAVVAGLITTFYLRRKAAAEAKALREAADKEPATAHD